jgi:hypothetical protein
MNNKTLEQIYVEHSGKVSDKWSLYLSEYDYLFRDLRNHRINMLEIGIQNGGSLEIWSKYFSNANSIVGCDINSDCSKLEYNSKVIGIVVGDANNGSVEKKICGNDMKFDIVIDDGSHTSGDIIKSFCRYFRHLKENGVFVAEDSHCSYWSSFDGGLYYPFSSISFFKRLADVVNFEHLGIHKTRKELLSSFIDKYNLILEEGDLQNIHSIYFANSLCVVRKQKSNLNQLGQRCVVGSDAIVYPVVRELNKTCSIALDQTQNPYTILPVPPEEAFFTIEKQNIELSAENQYMRNSLSWRLTKPFRIAFRYARKFLKGGDNSLAV